VCHLHIHQPMVTWLQTLPVLTFRSNLFNKDIFIFCILFVFIICSFTFNFNITEVSIFNWIMEHHVIIWHIKHLKVNASALWIRINHFHNFAHSWLLFLRIPLLKEDHIRISFGIIRWGYFSGRSSRRLCLILTYYSWIKWCINLPLLLLINISNSLFPWNLKRGINNSFSRIFSHRWALSLSKIFTVFFNAFIEIGYLNTFSFYNLSLVVLESHNSNVLRLF